VSFVNGALTRVATTRRWLGSLHLEHILMHTVDALVRDGSTLAASRSVASRARDLRLGVSSGLGASGPRDAGCNSACTAATTTTVASLGAVAAAARAS
jgi:hypothetical protein